MDPIRIEKHGDFLLLKAANEVTAESSAQCKETVDEFFTDLSFKGVVMDIGDLAGINSCGIGLMVTLHTKCVGQDSAFYIMNPNKHVLKTLDLVQLSNFFNLARSWDDIPGFPRPKEL